MQSSIFEDKVCLGHQEDVQREDPGQALTQLPLEVQRVCGALNLSNMYTVTTELHLIGFIIFN